MMGMGGAATNDGRLAAIGARPGWSRVVVMLALSACDETTLGLPGDLDHGAAGELAVPVACDETLTVAGAYEVRDDAMLEALRGCRRVVGELELAGHLTRYDALAEIQRVGDLNVVGTTLVSFSALRDLRAIDGSLTLRDNDRLVDLAGLERVAFGEPTQFTLPRIEIERNASLSELRGLEGLAHSGARQLRVRQNPSLESLVVPEVPAWISVDIADNDALVDLEIGGDVDGTLSIADNRSLTSLHSIAVRSVGELSVIDNLELLSVGLHPELEAASAITIVGGPQLRDVGRFSSLTELNSLTLQKLPSTASLDVLRAGTPVQVIRLERLDHAGLGELDLRIERSATLQELPGLAGLGSLQLESTLEVFRLVATGLEGVSALPDLAQVGALEVRANPGLGQAEVEAWCDGIVTETERICSPNGDGAACPFTNDQKCDEPEGTGLCPEGSDFPDCGGLPLP